MVKEKIVYILFFLILPIVAATHVPRPIGYVNDFANIISDDYEKDIGQLIADIEKNTTIEIVVVTVDSLNGNTIENFAVGLFEEWGIGKEKEDNGLLILIAKNDRAYRIEVGYGLEGNLNDAKVGRLARKHFTTNFQAGNFGKGIYEALIEIESVIKGEYAAEKSLIKDNPYSAYYFIFTIIYFTSLIIFYMRFGKIKNKNFGKKRQDRLGIFHSIITILTIFISWTLFVLFFFFTIFLLMFILGAQRRRSIGYYGGYGRIGGYGGGGGSFGGFGGGSSGGGGFSGRF